MEPLKKRIDSAQIIDHAKKEETFILSQRRRWKNVFSTLEGRVVFTELIANHLGAFRDNLETEGEIALANKGRELLDIVGCNNPDKTVDAIINAVLNVPATHKEE